MAKILEVEGLRVVFETPGGTVEAVNGLSFELQRGEILGIVGESGCGKSVSCQAVMRLVNRPGKITAGKVLFNDKDILTLSEREMSDIRGNRIAMIFQDPLTFFNPVMRIGDQIVEPLVRHLKMKRPQARKRAQELLSMVGIPSPEEVINAYPHEFSGGMRQRAMIAMALSCDPDILIADEPTTALDVTVQIQIIELIKKLQRERHMSVIWITHDLGIVAGLCNRVNILYAGDVVESAPVNALYANPKHPYTQGLFRSIPRMDSNLSEALECIPGVPPKLDKLPVGCAFQERCPKAGERCRRERPIQQEYGPDHRVACFEAKGVKERGAAN